MNPVVTQSLTLIKPAGQKATASLDQVLPKGQTIEARVTQVVQDRNTPNLYRLRLEASSSLLELKTAQPIARDSQVQISRNEQGQVSIRVQPQSNASAQAGSNTTQQASQNLATNVSAQAQQNVQQAISSANQVRVYQAPVQIQGNINNLNQQLPPNSSILVSVISQTTQSSPGAQQNIATQQTAGATNPSTVAQPSVKTGAQSGAQLGTFIQNAVQPSGEARTNGPNTQTAQTSQTTTLNTSANSNTSTPPATQQSTISQPDSGKAANSNQSNTLTNTQTNTPAPVPQTVQQGQTASASSPASTGIQQPQTAPQQNPTGNSTQTPIPSNQSEPKAQSNQQATTQQSANSGRTFTNQTALANQIQVALPSNDKITLHTNSNLPTLNNIQLVRDTQNNLTIRWSAAVQTPPPAQGTPLSQSQIQVVETTLRQHLPLQAPLNDSLQQLVSLTNTHQATDTAGKQINQVVQSLLQLFGVQPGAADSQQAVRQNINMGGLFTENQLANQQVPTNDMKQFLGKLQNLADQLPNSHQQKAPILQTIEQLQSRITVNQVQNLHQRADRVDANERFFQLDLPVKYQDHLDNVEMRIQQRAHRNPFDEWETVWKVRLNFDLQEQGSVTADISLNDQQKTISASFTCSEPNTTALLKERTDEFRSQIHRLGLDVPTLICRQGEMPKTEAAPVQKTLIDIKT